jgi:hypothetical protein
LGFGSRGMAGASGSRRGVNLFLGKRLRTPSPDLVGVEGLGNLGFGILPRSCGIPHGRENSECEIRKLESGPPSSRGCGTMEGLK